MLKGFSKEGGVYKITCLVSLKFYIGSSINLHVRLNRHLKELKKGIHSNTLLQRAWVKYGEENFKFEVLEYCHNDVCREREQYYLDNLLFAQEYVQKESHRFIELGFNMKPTSNSNFGYKQSEEHIANRLGKMQGVNHPWYGKKWSEERKSNFIKLVSGTNNFYYGKSRSDDQKKKQSVAMSGEKHPNYGKKLCKETRYKISERHKRVVIILNLNTGVFDEIPSVSEAAILFKTSIGHLIRVLRKDKSYKNHIIFYK